MTTEQALLTEVSDVHFKALFNIELTNGWQCNVQDNFFKNFKLSHQQYNILRILRGQKEHGVSVNDIKRRMIDKMSNVSRLIEKLHVKGFVERQECPHDGRVVYVQLTVQGTALLTDIDAELPKMRRIFDTLTVEEATELVRLLEKFRDTSNENNI